MKDLNLSRAVFAGLAATAVMTAMTMMAGLMGVNMDIPAMLSGFMKMPLVIGWVAHFMIGTVLALIYAFFFVDHLPGAGWVRGAIYGLFPFLLAQVAVMPMMGMGIFTANAPNQMMLVMGSLIGHLVYGAVLGGLYGYVAEPARVRAA